MGVEGAKKEPKKPDFSCWKPVALVDKGLWAAFEVKNINLLLTFILKINESLGRKQLKRLKEKAEKIAPSIFPFFGNFPLKKVFQVHSVIIIGKGLRLFLRQNSVRTLFKNSAKMVWVTKDDGVVSVSIPAIL